MNMLEEVIGAALNAGRAIMNIYTHPDTDWQVERKADNSPLTLADRQAHAIIAEALTASPYPLLSEEGEHLPYDQRKDWDKCWIVDPLDGTKEFLKRNDEFTVNIALVKQGVPVLGVIYAPALFTLYYGTKSDGAFMAHVDPLTYEIVAPAQRLNPAAGAAAGLCRVVASRSHLSEPTQAYIDHLKQHYADVQTVNAGSSIKLCLIAAGQADVYPRMAPTMEWDTAAGHAIALAAGCEVVEAATQRPLTYNKPDLHNPYFIVRRAGSAY